MNISEEKSRKITSTLESSYSVIDKEFGRFRRLSESTKPLKKEIREKRLLLIGIVLMQLISFLLVTYFKYKNQDVLLRRFSPFRASDFITLAFFVAVSLSCLAVYFRTAQIRTKRLVFLFALSIAGLVSYLISETVTVRETKIALVSALILTSLYIFISLTLAFFISPKRPYILKTVFLSLTCLALITGMFFYKIYNYKDNFEAYSVGSRKADAGVILGAAVWGGNRPSPVLRERINKGFVMTG